MKSEMQDNAKNAMAQPPQVRQRWWGAGALAAPLISNLQGLWEDAPGWVQKKMLRADTAAVHDTQEQLQRVRTGE